MNHEIGSQEFSDEEFIELQKTADDYTKELETAATTSQLAKEFLNSPVGRKVREIIGFNKGYHQEQCTKSTGQSLVEAQFNYKVWQEVGSVFGQIIVVGNEALNELETLRAENHG